MRSCLGIILCAITKVLGDGWTIWRRFTVAERQAEAEGLVSFVLRPEDGGRAVVHRPVQYLTLHLGAAGLPRVNRNHPISSKPGRPGHSHPVNREAGGEAPTFRHDDAQVATTPPAGDCDLADSPLRPVVRLSGGVALTPMVRIGKSRPIPSTEQAAPHITRWPGRCRTPRIAMEISFSTVYEGGAGILAHPGRISRDWLRTSVPQTEADIDLCGPRSCPRYVLAGLRQGAFVPTKSAIRSLVRG